METLVKRRLCKSWKIKSINIDIDDSMVEVMVKLDDGCGTFSCTEPYLQSTLFSFDVNSLENTCTMFEIGNIIEFDVYCLNEEDLIHKPFSINEKLLLDDIVKHAFLLSLEGINRVDYGKNLFVMTVDKYDTPRLAKVLKNIPNIIIKEWKPNRTESNLLTALFTIEKPASKATNTSNYRKKR